MYMQYFKNAELAARYHVHGTTLTKWIEAAQQGKIDLELCERGNKVYIADTAKNAATIERLIEERKKYRNARGAKTVTPRDEFYRLFTQAQIYDIVRNLEMHHEIPRQYNYFDGGASEWDEYSNRLAAEDSPNLLNQTVELIAENQGYMDKRLAKYKRVNVVDIGVGNGLPAKELLRHLLAQGKLGRYIAIDISQEILSLAERNIKEWFGGRVEFHGFELDITHERFANILAEDYLKADAKEAANLLLFLGGTPYNFRYPDDAFRTIRDSMNVNDLLIYTDRIEEEFSRPQWLDYNVKQGKQTLAPMHRLVFDMLNIEQSMYDVDVGYDDASHQRYTRARLKVALTLKFAFEDGERILEFHKGDTILLWRSWDLSAQEAVNQFQRCDFSVLHASLSEDREYILTVAQVKCS